MRRFIGDFKDGSFIFKAETLKHMKVVRLKLDEEFEVLTQDGIYLAKLTNLSPLTFMMIAKKEIERELPIELTVFIPLLKRDNFELSVVKAVELGAKTIIPYISERTIKRLTKAEFASKKGRYMRLIEEAVEQSNRDIIPTFLDLVDIDELSSFSFDRAYVPYEELSISSELLDPSTHFNKGESVAVIVGPEGGFSKDEIEQLCSNGFKPISLGKRILRAETAVFASLSIIGYLAEVEHEL